MQSTQLLQTLQSVFGFDSLRQGQQPVIESVMNGYSAAAIFPTGSGKSLCYQLPATMLPNLTLVISPLLALMKDQLSFLQSKGISAASIDSSQSREEAQRVMVGVKNGEIKILMISVERLKNERFREFIRQVPISLMVVDEAHCISEWGHNFRPDYLKLPQYQRELNIPQTLLLTATATPAVIEDMKNKFDIASDHITVTGFYRSNLDISVIPCEESEKQTQLNTIVAAAPKLPTIVYVTQQQTAEQVAKSLIHIGVNAHAYHAGMKSEVREQIQQQFMAGQIDCIVATIAFGMGVDKSDIRRVIHFDLPKSIENYAQEIGRAGRDGQRSECILLGNTSGLTVLENFVFGDTPERSSISYVLAQIKEHQPQWEVVPLRLSRESNIRQLPLKTLLVYLELAKVIEAKFSYFAEYRFKFLQNQQFIVNQFQGERREFVEAIFTCSTKAKVWCQVDLDALWMHYHSERSRVVAALDYFHQNGWVELESKQLTDVYSVLSDTQNIEDITQHLYELFQSKERKDIDRIHAMLGLFQSSDCLSHQLASYFADHNAPAHCGHCSVCRGQRAVFPPRIYDQPEPAVASAWIAEFVQLSPSAISNEAITRFLCGISTPLISQLKASKLSGYGALANVSFEQVLQLVESVRE
ncbi:RecQ family ATP-dependent DNA helicase [Vibrio parahaemolyticus]|uniref:RecQ family ATP-dependent DNA helicase n=2 Tax=Vibrio parahaemolyticus TaxID=670 RepID=UPI0015DE6D38|nr:RecQ family ATP-dependent DNA helicase [Vibrio parahaemolyticus]EJG1180945.1 RecQ family ATP-dependent DNA helicase [Vibrio parahaemolyticus]EJG1189743.1 RecQ family ATP-dependent DNA helicase [Vibrio parahaemolyticus]ELB2268531.1 RecQ family ATP-dependent DNA helicase [Vibrio parahaemolyticus]MBE4465764.1 RecQ family ATP-dependent DNA helicase [Vibrio parahaemolyticus]MBM5079606.1 RecQ family ATP-dependent DNA helicase [Vibrio parahaemolyticus]